MSEFSDYVDNLFNASTSMPMFLLALCTLLLTAFQAWHNRKSSLALRRLEAVISPAFDLIKPHMLKNSSAPKIETLNCVYDLLKAHSLMIGGKLRRFLYLTPEDLVEGGWIDLCRALSSHYDILCLEAGISLRPALYRVIRYKWAFVRYSIPVAVLHFVVNLLFGFAFLLSIPVGRLLCVERPVG